jgi:hypothetical protein
MTSRFLHSTGYIASVSLLWSGTHRKGPSGGKRLVLQLILDRMIQAKRVVMYNSLFMEQSVKILEKYRLLLRYYNQSKQTTNW